MIHGPWLSWVGESFSDWVFTFSLIYHLFCRRWTGIVHLLWYRHQGNLKHLETLWTLKQSMWLFNRQTGKWQTVYSGRYVNLGLLSFVVEFNLKRFTNSTSLQDRRDWLAACLQCVRYSHEAGVSPSILTRVTASVDKCGNNLNKTHHYARRFRVLWYRMFIKAAVNYWLFTKALFTLSKTLTPSYTFWYEKNGICICNKIIDLHWYGPNLILCWE